MHLHVHKGLGVILGPSNAPVDWSAKVGNGHHRSRVEFCGRGLFQFWMCIAKEFLEVVVQMFHYG
jgi:hypothetical protein